MNINLSGERMRLAETIFCLGTERRKTDLSPNRADKREKFWTTAGTIDSGYSVRVN